MTAGEGFARSDTRRMKTAAARNAAAAAIGIFALIAGLTQAAHAQYGDLTQASESAEPVSEVYDPLENMNRFFFRVNDSGDKYFLKPVAQAYDEITPEFAQIGIRNFLDNVDTPTILANDILQGEFTRAGETFSRFIINSTIGVAGFVDLADRWGLERHREDFGQTLAVWGVEEGPYLYLPIFGPAPPRDFVGRIVDQVFDPTTWIQGHEVALAGFVRTGIGIIELRARNLETLDEIERTSIDFYAAVRSLYLQSRAGAIRNGEVDLENLPDFSEEFELEDFD